MTVTKVTLTTPTPSGLATVSLPIVGLSPSDPYIVKNIDGLGPTDPGISIANTLAQGGVYRNRRAVLRQIPIDILLNPNYSAGQTVETLRNALYRFVVTHHEQPVTVTVYKNGNVWATISGHVSKFENALFTKDPVVQIVIDCLVANFSETNAIQVPISGLGKTAFTVVNPGSATCGVNLVLDFTANRNQFFYIQDDIGNRMQFDYNFFTGDRLIINTTPGARSAGVSRNSEYTGLMYTMTDESSWLDLQPGLNNFTAPTSTFNWYSISFIPQYVGI